jgi:hypothetical protein
LIPLIGICRLNLRILRDSGSVDIWIDIRLTLTCVESGVVRIETSELRDIVDGDVGLVYEFVLLGTRQIHLLLLHQFAALRSLCVTYHVMSNLSF